MQQTNDNEAPGANSPSPKAVFEAFAVLDVGHIVAGPLRRIRHGRLWRGGAKNRDARSRGSSAENASEGRRGTVLQVQARNKKSITLNLKSPEGI